MQRKIKQLKYKNNINKRKINTINYTKFEIKQKLKIKDVIVQQVNSLKIP